jgi:hypothetical protein
MTTANGTLNARTARKSLADQIDRLDTILDGLAEALNESIADAVKDVIAETVRQAVHAAVTEVLSSPDLLRAALEKHAPVATLSEPPPAPEAKPPTVKENVVRIASGLCEKVKRAASLVKEKLNAAARTTRTALAVAPFVLRAVARKVWAYRKPCAVAVGVGVVCGAVCYLGGQLFSSIANGLSGAALTISAMTLPLKRLFWGGNR